MKKLFRLFLIPIAITTVLFSCTKQADTKTSADEIVTELQRVISDKQIKRVYPVKYNDVFPNSFPTSTGTQWTFSNGFIQINYGLSSTYNLLFLRYYDVASVFLSDGSTSQALILYF